MVDRWNRKTSGKQETAFFVPPWIGFNLPGKVFDFGWADGTRIPLLGIDCTCGCSKTQCFFDSSILAEEMEE